MTSKEKENLDYQLKLEAQVLLDQAKKLVKSPLVQFAAGFIAMDLYLGRRK